jgi:hypothetical protein
MKLEWASSNIKYKPSSDELYQPPKAGFSIKAYTRSLGRFMAKRGRGQTGFTKSACFYSVEDAKAWLDSLPEYPDVEQPVGREWLKDYRFESGRYVHKSDELKIDT